jgi:hypothetical protein
VNKPLPQLRPYARQGKPYVAELKAIYKEVRYDLKHDYETTLYRNGRVVLADCLQLALKYQLQPHALFEYLEDMNLLPCGTYERLKQRDLRPMMALRKVWEAQQKANAQ